MAFNALPIEINEHIACYLPSDSDLVSFMLICHATHGATESYRCGLWRILFARRFDLPKGKTGSALKLKYQVHTRALQRHVNWKMGHGSKEARVLEILQELVVESYAHLPLGTKAKALSNNIIALRTYVQRSNLLNKVLSCLQREQRIFNPTLKTLQLTLTHFTLDPSLKLPTIGFEHSQKEVYAHPSKQPLFQGKSYNRINTDLIMHTVNFFKHHMMVPEAQTLYDMYHELEDHQRPQAWDSRLHQGLGVQRLGMYWKGSYAYLHDFHDMRCVRTAAPGTTTFTDTIDFYDGFQTLELDFSPLSNTTPWPKAFESHLKAMPPIALCKRLDKLARAERPQNAYPGDILSSASATGLRTPPSTPVGFDRNVKAPIPDEAPCSNDSGKYTPSLTAPKRGIHYHQFGGSGRDADPFNCSGILHPLPPQDGIPGWQRLTMLKYFDSDADAPNDPESPSSSPSGPSTPDHPSTSTTTSGASASSSHSSQTSEPATTNFTVTPETGWPSPSDFTPINAGFPAHNPQDVDVDNACWAYEGVVLPGGKIIVGRWWSPTQDMEEFLCMGPFIFWEVDEP